MKVYCPSTVVSFGNEAQYDTERSFSLVKADDDAKIKWIISITETESVKCPVKSIKQFANADGVTGGGVAGLATDAVKGDDGKWSFLVSDPKVLGVYAFTPVITLKDSETVKVFRSVLTVGCGASSTKLTASAKTFPTYQSFDLQKVGSEKEYDFEFIAFESSNPTCPLEGIFNKVSDQANG